MHHGGWFNFISSDQVKPKVTLVLLRRVFAYARKYLIQIAMMLLMILISTAFTLATPLILRDLIDRTIPSSNIPRLISLAVALMLIPALNGIITVVSRRLNAFVGEGVIFDLRRALYAHLQSMSLRFFTNTKVGELMSRLNNDVIGAQNAISNTFVNIITNLIQAVSISVVMIALEWRLTLVSVAILPLFFFTARSLGKKLREIARAQMQANAQMNAMMNETLNISGALLVKLFGRSQVEIERFEQRAGDVRDLGIQRGYVGSMFFVILGLVGTIGTALVYGIGGYLAIRNAFTIGTIVAFGSYLNNLYGALQGLTNAPVEFATSIVSFERVFEVLDLPVEIEERPNAREFDALQGDLVFENVSFNYRIDPSQLLSDVKRPGSMLTIETALSGSRESSGTTHPRKNGQGEDEPPPGLDDQENDIQAHGQAREYALENISFHAAPGQLTALVGPSGAGKTTLTYLIPRLYDPTSGRITLDGHDLRDVRIESLSRQVGMVTQETHLFHDTIRTNLLYARLDASQKSLEEACRAANIHDFISGLPNRYDTVVGERGYRLSGGEKQRLALARVILKDPRILVLDEATSSLDSESEALIQQALKRVLSGRTSIVIAHRLSTILAADQIMVMDRGRIVESGTHSQLLANEGLYAQLYRTQFAKQP